MTKSKKRTSVWIDPEVLRELKFMGVEHDQPIGNVIEALVKFSKNGTFDKDESFQRRFGALLKMSLGNAGRRVVQSSD